MRKINKLLEGTKQFFLVSIVILCPFSVFGTDDFPEPFGLSWNMSEGDLDKLGFTDTGRGVEGFNVFSSVSVPKPWSKGDRYLAVTYKNRLVKASALSVDITDDIYGSEGKEMYKQMKALLAKKYGDPSDHYEFVGADIYDESDEFYQCLNYSGCGGYASMFQYLGGTIAVQLNGLTRGKGYLSITYESPGFEAAKRQSEKEAEESDADVF